MSKLTTNPAAADLTADSAGRTITGAVLPYGVTGRTSAGPVTVAAGAVQIPADLKRVKLFRDHSNAGGTPVGYATAAHDADGALTMSFRVGPGADGDQALADAAGGVRDALSVELVNVQLSADRRTVTSAQLSAVALVPIPAFDDARVTDVTASHQEIAMPPETETTTAPATESGPAPAVPGSPATTPAPVSAPSAPIENGPVITAAAAPLGLPTTTAPRPLSLDDVYDTLHAARQGDMTLTAALANITRSANPWVSPDGWVGELWSGVGYQREIVPLLTHGALKHWTVTGWRWVTKPEVDDYVGDKNEVPTNPVATESVSIEAKRLAGAHDLDRKFWDFNDAEFIRSYFAGMAESYAFQSDQRAAQFVIANAAVPATNNTAASLLKAVALGIHHVKTGPTRARATFALVNPLDYLDLMDMTDFDLPAYLKLFSFEPERLTPSEHVPAGKVVVGAKQAVTFYELGGSPIRVEAVNLAHGGRDAALFGYYATLLHDDGGLVTINYTPAP